MPVNQQNLNGEGHGAAQQQHVPLVDAVHAGAAEQIQPYHRRNQAEHCVFSWLPSYKQPQKGHKDNIHGSEKACLARVCVYKPHLLQAAGGEQGQAADDAGLPQRRVFPAVPEAFSPWEQGRYREQEQHRQGASHGLEGKGSDFVHAHALGNESGAPDDGAS